MEQKMIRSVLVAGLHTSTNGNQFMRYCEDLWLRTEHLEEVTPSKPIPTKYDAAIIVPAVASHAMFHRVKETYAGKAIFVATSGISSIKDAFEAEVFGGEEVLRKLREVPTEHPRHSNAALPISVRFWWLLANFVTLGETVKYKDITRFFDKFIIKGQESAISNVWQKGRTTDCLTDISHGTAIFNGIPFGAYETLVEHKMPCPEDIVMKHHNPPIIVSKKSQTAPIEQSHVQLVQVAQSPEPAATDPAPVSDPAQELLLEAMTAQQEEIRLMKAAFSETMKVQQSEIREIKELLSRVPATIENQFRGVTRIVDSIVPKLKGLSPAQAEKVDQMIDLMLSMGKG